MNRFYFFVYVSQADIADGSFCLADRLNDGSCCGHAKDAVHIVLVLQDTFLKEFVCSGRRFARIGYDLHVGAAHFFPVLDLSCENAFQLFTRQVGHFIGRVYDYRQCVVSDHHFFGAFLCFLQFDFFIEFHLTGRHGDIGCPFHQG